MTAALPWEGSAELAVAPNLPSQGLTFVAGIESEPASSSLAGGSPRPRPEGTSQGPAELAHPPPQSR